MLFTQLCSHNTLGKAWFSFCRASTNIWKRNVCISRGSSSCPMTSCWKFCRKQKTQQGELLVAAFCRTAVFCGEFLLKITLKLLFENLFLIYLIVWVDCCAFYHINFMAEISSNEALQIL